MAGNALNIANKLANMFNGSKPKAPKAPQPEDQEDTFQKIGKNMANKGEAAKKVSDAFKKSLGGN